MKIIAGVDEAGRGALAGPVVASAVILPEEYDLDGLDSPKNNNFNEENIINELKPQSSQRLLVIGEAIRLNIDKKNYSTNN